MLKNVFRSDGSGVPTSLLHVAWTDNNWRTAITKNISTSRGVSTANFTGEQALEYGFKGSYACMDCTHFSCACHIKVLSLIRCEYQSRLNVVI